MGNPGVHWFRTAPSARHRPGPDGARNTRARDAPGRSAFLVAPGGRLTARYSHPRAFSLNRARLHPPDAGCVFGNCTVTEKLPRTRHAQDGLARPGIPIVIELTYSTLGLYV